MLDLQMLAGSHACKMVLGMLSFRLLSQLNMQRSMPGKAQSLSRHKLEPHAPSPAAQPPCNELLASLSKAYSKGSPVKLAWSFLPCSSLPQAFACLAPTPCQCKVTTYHGVMHASGP